jgi:transcriptional regulator with XRE-family HTH domain
MRVSYERLADLSRWKGRCDLTFYIGSAVACYLWLVVAKRSRENAVARLKRRIAERIDADHDKPRAFRRTQMGLADRIGITKQTLNELLNGPSSNRGLLAHLDKIAEYFGVPPSLLVHANDTSLMELHQGEWVMLQHWRRLSPEVQESLLAMLEYFAGILPEEKEQRRLWMKWRRLTAAEREGLERTLDDQLRGRRLQQGQDSDDAVRPSSPGTRAATGTQE